MTILTNSTYTNFYLDGNWFLRMLLKCHYCKQCWLKQVLQICHHCWAKWWNY